MDIVNALSMNAGMNSLEDRFTAGVIFALREIKEPTFLLEEN